MYKTCSIAFVCLSIVLLLSACNSNNEPLVSTTSVASAGVPITPEYAPGAPTEFRTVEVDGEEFTYGVINDQAILEADIMLGPVEEFEEKVEEAQNDGISAQSFGTTDFLGNYRFWPSGRIYYAFDSNVTDIRKAVIRRAIEHWEDATLLRFDERASGARIVFKLSADAGECTSDIGYPGNNGIV